MSTKFTPENSIQEEFASEATEDLGTSFRPTTSTTIADDACSTSTSMSSVSTSADIQQINLVEHLSEESKFFFSALVAIILRLDFQEPTEKDFRKKALDLLIQQFELSPKVGRSVREHMNNERCPHDIVPYISKLKADEFIQDNTAAVLLAELVALFVGTGIYDCRYRVLMQHLAAVLAIRWEEVEGIEDKVAHLLIEENYVETEEEREAKNKKERRKKFKRYALIGASGAVGGVLIGLTGGLAAPWIAAGAGVVIGTGAAAGIATTAGAAILGSLFGVAGAGLAGYKMQKRVGAVEEFTVETLKNGQSLHLAICVSGWIEEEREDAFTWSWRHLNMSKEEYCLRYESKYLLQLGKAMDYFMSIAVSYAIQQTLMETALASLMSAIAWPVALVSVASVLDNPWNVCINRAAEVGHILSDILLARQQGQRPVTLLGYSLGARVIYHCLLDMAKRPKCDGIVQDVVLLGAPVTGSASEWKQMCRVVGGRVINGYCKTDWLLKFLYRTMSAQMSIAGVAPVEHTGVRKIVNVNLSHIIQGHMDYRKKLTEVLQCVGIPTTPHSSESYASLTAAVSNHKIVKTPSTPSMRTLSPQGPIAESNLDT